MLLRKIVITAGLILSSVVGVFGSNSLDANVLLRSISEVETGGQYWHVGASGERSLYQIKADVWRKYSSVPFWRAATREYQAEAKRVAICYINEISQTLVTYDVMISAQSIALRWNGGLNRTRFLRRHHSYATRVSNLYDYYIEHGVAEYIPTTTAVKPIQIVLLPLSDDSNIPVMFSRPAAPAAPKITISTDEPVASSILATM